MNGKYELKVCPICGEYYTTKWGSLYCSNQCAEQAGEDIHRLDIKDNKKNEE